MHRRKTRTNNRNTTTPREMANTNYIYTRSCWFCSEAILYYSASLLTIWRVNIDVAEAYWFEIDQSGSPVPQFCFWKSSSSLLMSVALPLKKKRIHNVMRRQGLPWRGAKPQTPHHFSLLPRINMTTDNTGIRTRTFNTAYIMCTIVWKGLYHL